MTALTWDDIPDPRTKGSSGPRGESVIADIEVGSNFFRIVDNQFERTLIYWAFGGMQKSADEFDTRFEDRICPLTKELDEKGEPYRPRPYYLFKALDRRSGQIKILRVSQQVAQNLKELAKSGSWGDLTRYDVNITRRPKGTNPLYLVMPSPPTELTAEEKALVAASELNLKNLARPAKVEWVQKFIDDRKNGKRSAQPSTGAERPAASRAPAKPAPVVDNDFSLGTDDFNVDIDNI